MKNSSIYFFFLVLVCLQCRVKYPKPDKDPDYKEHVRPSGYVNTMLSNYDDGFYTISGTQYKIGQKSAEFMLYDLLKPEDSHRDVYDTFFFHFNFKDLDSSFYAFSDNEYNRTLKKYECIKTSIPLTYKEKLPYNKYCEDCNIYKFESLYHNKCYTWFISDSIGFVKAYAPYHNDVADFEIHFIDRNPKYTYLIKLLKSIKADKQFHTRCSPGILY